MNEANTRVGAADEVGAGAAIVEIIESLCVARSRLAGFGFDFRHVREAMDQALGYARRAHGELYRVAHRAAAKRIRHQRHGVMALDAEVRRLQRENARLRRELSALGRSDGAA